MSERAFPADAGGTGAPGLEKLLTPQEIAEAWQIDVSGVRRAFQDVPGVLKLASATGSKKKRGYVTLRVPLRVYEAVVRERSR